MSHGLTYLGYLLLAQDTIGGGASGYRGVYRKEPQYPEKTIEERGLWKRFAYAHKVQSAFIESKEEALNLLYAYSEYNKFCDLVKIAHVNYDSFSSRLLKNDDEEFLGFDVGL